MIERLPYDFCTIICGQKSYSYRREAATGSIVCYICPDRCTIFRSAIFQVRFFSTSKVIMGYDVGVYNSYGHRTISCSGFLRCFESEPLGDLREMVGSQHT